MRDEISSLQKSFGDDFSLQTGNRLQSAALEMTVAHRPRGLVAPVPNAIEYQGH
jgi:hypothetical protein